MASLPREFDGYQLISRLGKGGMGEVYLARDTLLERHVAIKFITATRSDEVVKARFLLEARAFARLQHPNVVSIYRVGEIEGTPYLVSEYVHGRSLDAVQPETFTPGQLIQIAQGIAKGLAAAHKQGVIHRDIKPGNVMITETFEAKLLDFGIAKLLESMGSDTITLDSLPSAAPPPLASQNAALPHDDAAGGISLTRPGMAVGTPRYMAPEVWRGHEATFRSDVYSFGALMYYLATGHPPHTGATPKEIGKKAVSQDARPLLEVAPHVPPALAAIVDRCLRRDPAQRFADGNALRAALAQLNPAAPNDLLPAVDNPFVATAPMQESHHRWFFGRDDDIRALLDRLRTESLLLIAGPHGAGKTSLVRAGLLPRLSTLGRTWHTVILSPGNHPITALASHLADFFSRTEQELETTLRTAPDRLLQHLRATRSATNGIAIVLDDLEDVFTAAAPSERKALFSLLGWLATASPQLRTIACIRSDALHPLTDALGASLIASHTYFVAPMSAGRAVETLAAVAEHWNRPLDAALRAALRAIAQPPSGLTLCQLVLHSLWSRDDAPTLSAETLEAAGGIDGILDGYLLRTLTALPGPMAAEATRILHALQKDETTSLVHVERRSPTAAVVTTHLVRAGIIAVEDTPGGARVRLSCPAFGEAAQALLPSTSPDPAPASPLSPAAAPLPWKWLLVGLVAGAALVAALERLW